MKTRPQTQRQVPEQLGKMVVPTYPAPKAYLLESAELAALHRLSQARGAYLAERFGLKTV